MQLTKSPSNSAIFLQSVTESDHDLADIATKVYQGTRISVDDGIRLINSNDLFVLGQLAHYARERKAYEVALRNGFDELTAQARKTQVWWNTNLHLNPTNVCIGECDFCSFARKPNEEGAYTMTISEAIDKVAIARDEGATEVHIVGGLNPKTLIEYYSDLIRAIKTQVPGIHVKAFTAVEIEFFSRFTKTNYSDIFDALIAAGLDSMPGGGAEIFSKSVRDEMCPDKIPYYKWVEIHQTAHSKGLRTNATMLAGIGEEPEDRVDHLDILRRAQDESLDLAQSRQNCVTLVSRDPHLRSSKLRPLDTRKPCSDDFEQGLLNNSTDEHNNADGASLIGDGGFQTFIPLSCHYEGNDLLERGVKPLTGFDQLKNIAVSRLMLDNFDHIKAYWVQLGPKMAELALHFGANDLDGTVKAERITFAAGAQTRSMTENTLIEMIENAGFSAIERDTLYRPIEMSAHKKT